MIARYHGGSPLPDFTRRVTTVASSHVASIVFTKPVYEMLPEPNMTFTAYNQLLEDIGLEFDASHSKTYKYYIIDIKKFMTGRLKYGI